MVKFLRYGLLAAAALAALPASADELTVCDGTATNEYLPFYGYYWDVANHSQMIYPASMLTELQGKEITAMSYYFQSVAKQVMTPEATVLVGPSPVSQFEVGNASMLSNEGLTAVYEAYTEFNTSSTGWRIEFSTPYSYTGGDLLVEIDNTAGVYGKVVSYGANTENPQSAYSRGLTAIATCPAYLPKTTFEYSASQVDGVEDIEAADSNATAEFYNLQGVRVNPETAAPGIYVKRQGSKTSKVVVR